METSICLIEGIVYKSRRLFKSVYTFDTIMHFRRDRWKMSKMNQTLELCYDASEEKDCKLRYGLRRYRQTTSPTPSLAMTYICQKVDRKGLTVREVNKEIGKGVFADISFVKGEFILEYDGELISGAEARKREKEYPLEYGSFIFFFAHKGKNLGLDGTFSKRLGRYVNDGVGEEKNCDIKLIEVDNKPHLAIFASRNITPGEELRYDYGVKDLPWRTNKKKNATEEAGTAKKKSIDVIGTIVSSADKYLKVVKDCRVELVRLSVDTIKGLKRSRENSLQDRAEADNCAVSALDKDMNIVDTMKVVETASKDQSQLDCLQEQELITKSKQKHKDNRIFVSAIVHACQDSNMDDIHEEIEVPHQRNDSTEIHNLAEQNDVQELEGVNDIHEEIEVPHQRNDSTEVHNLAKQNDVQELKGIEEHNLAEENDVQELEGVNDIHEEIKVPHQRNDSTEVHNLAEQNDVQELKGIEEHNLAEQNDVQELESVNNIHEEIEVPHKKNDSTEVHNLAEQNDGQELEGIEVHNLAGQQNDVQDIEEYNLTEPLKSKGSQGFDNAAKKKTVYKRPKRPCPFCGKFFRRLSEHLKSKVHQKEEFVQVAVTKPKPERDQIFKELRRTGYHKVNVERVKQNTHADLITERSRGQDKEHAICSFCKGVFRIPYISRHKRTCQSAEGTTAVPVSIPISLITEPKENQLFVDNILAKFKDDEVGNLCRSDRFIKKYGSHRFRKFTTRVDKRQEIRTNVMCEMRRLAGLFLAFCREAEKIPLILDSVDDLFKRQHFNMLQDAITAYTTREDGSQKSGLKRGIGYLLKRAGKFLKCSLIIALKDDEIKEIDYFLLVLNIFWIDVFDDAEYNCKKARQRKLRKPKRLPVEAEVTLLRKYTLKEIKEICTDKYKLLSKEEFVRLRNVVASRLTLFNARRGGEPSRLELTEWDEAKNGCWLDKNMVRAVTDPLEKMLLGKYKLAYQSGKNLVDLVPNLIPEDCWTAITRLADPGNREAAGVNKDNIYLFPHIRNSVFHVGGWKCTESACKMAGLSTVITATDMRHRASTLYAALDVSEHDRATFYRHMGHSEEVNKNVYQCPVGVKEITTVGKFLEHIEDLPIEEQEEEEMDTDNIDEPKASASENFSELRVQQILHQFAETEIVNRACSGRGLIEEDEVETMPENLLPFKHVILNKNLQKKLKCFFTEDGWLVAENTIKMLKDNEDESDNSSDSDSFDSDLLESDNSSGEEDILTSSRKPKDEKQNNRKRKVTACNDSGSEYRPDPCSSSEEEEDKEMKSVKKRKLKNKKTNQSSECSSGVRVKWSEKDSAIIKNYFKDVIEDISTLAPTGKLPGQAVIRQFLRTHPDILSTVTTEAEKIEKIKNKLFNDRKTVRLNYKQFMEKKMR